MLTANVQQDYKNDWIQRCLNLKSINYSSLSSKKIHWIFNEKNPLLTNAMIQIFNGISKKTQGFSVDFNNFTAADTEKTLTLIWDLKDFPINDEMLDKVNVTGNNVLFITDKDNFPQVTSRLSLCKVFVLYCGLIYGAGFSDILPQENDCTNVLDFFGAQLFLLSNANNINGTVYYVGHGKCSVSDILDLQELGYPPMISYDDGRYMLEFSKSNPDKLFYFDNTYGGNLKLLHELLLKCLVEFDRICRKHGIKYFLGGGTLLGAIRHGGMIPWDDDMDVMMLRPDYEKFLSVVNNELNDNMFFQSSKTDDEYHSIFTKIRLNDTLFVTEYSQQFKNMHQGIFIDIFVHDHTSNNRLMQKLHVFKTLFARSLVFHKWARTPMHFYGRLKLICKLATKYMNKTSMEKLEDIQDKVIQKYNKKNTNYLYDGTGEHLKHGAFPAKWLEGVRYADFEGYKFPVPEKSDEYLKYSYGNYKEWIPASLRKAGHDIIKVDFGKYKSNK